MFFVTKNKIMAKISNYTLNIFNLKTTFFRQFSILYLYNYREGILIMDHKEKQKKIIEMVEKITNEEILRFLFEFVKAGLREERAS